MSWTTRGLKIKNGEVADEEFHNWREENYQSALDWVSAYAKKGWIVTIYHRKDGVSKNDSKTSKHS